MLSGTQIENAARTILHRSETMVTAPTASGKSTYIPLEIYRQLRKELPREQIRIVVSVPTRISVEYLSARVQELAKDTDAVVDSRFKGKRSRSDANIVYSVTTFLLFDYMQALERSQKASAFPWTVIIVDEVHTGNLDNSLVFSFHEILDRRYRNLKTPTPPLAMLTATPVDIFMFPDAYKERLALTVEAPQGAYMRQQPPPFFLEKSLSPKELMGAIVERIETIHKNNDRYSILVFVEGVHSCNTIYEKLTSKKIAKLEVLKAHGSMSKNDRARLHMDPKSGIRRVIIATNVAESSITIPYVGYVIDSMLEKRPARGILGSKSSLVLTHISQNSAIQRMGRAGREARVTKKMYYPMITEAEWNDKIKTQPFRTPDIQLVALEKITLVLISHGFNPRSILMEAGQETVNTTLLNLLENNLLRIVSFHQVGSVPNFEPASAHQVIYNRLIRGDIPTDIQQLKLSLQVALEAHLSELFEITSLGKSWLNFSMGMLPTIFLQRWIAEKKPGLLIGCLLAAIMDSEASRIFPFPKENPSSQGERRVGKHAYYSEALPQYIAEDPFTTILYVFYDLFLRFPECLSLRFDAQKIRQWVNQKQLNFYAIHEVLLNWRSIVSKLNDQSYYNFTEYLELTEAIKYMLDCLRPNAFFHLTKGNHKQYYRTGSQRSCFIDTSTIPYDLFDVPNQLIFLSIRESLPKDKTKPVETAILFLPRFYTQARHFKKQFVLQGRIPPIKDLLLEETDALSFSVRLPIVEPEDIGLIDNAFDIPFSLTGFKTELATAYPIHSLSIYPEVLTPALRRINRREEKVKEKEVLPELNAQEVVRFIMPEELLFLDVDILLDAFDFSAEGLRIDQDGGDMDIYDPALADVLTY